MPWSRNSSLTCRCRLKIIFVLGCQREEARRSGIAPSPAALPSRGRPIATSVAGPFMDTLLQDLRYGGRRTAQKPWFYFCRGAHVGPRHWSQHCHLLRGQRGAAGEVAVGKEPNRLVQLWETESSPGKFPLNRRLIIWIGQNQNHTLEGSSSSSATLRPRMEVTMVFRNQSLVQRSEATYFSVLGANAAAGTHIYSAVTISPAGDVISRC